MKKLIELLNEYEKVREKSEYQKLSNKEYKWFSSYFFPLCFGHQENFSGAMTNEFGEGTENVICSKKFGFIKWLVENDKIDREKFGNSETKSSKYSDFELSYDTPREDYTNILLMELAIRDNPLSFILDILK